MTCASAGLHSPRAQFLEPLGEQTPAPESPRTEPSADICHFWDSHTSVHTHVLWPSRQLALEPDQDTTATDLLQELSRLSRAIMSPCIL